MTNFTIAAKWVVAFALPLLAVTLTAAWLSYILSRDLDKYRHERMPRGAYSQGGYIKHRLYSAFERARRRRRQIPGQGTV